MAPYLRLHEDFQRIGIKRGMTLMVHSSLSSIGWVEGGPVTVVRAILSEVGIDGTVVMPSATPQCSDPTNLATPRIPAKLRGEVQEHVLVGALVPLPPE